MVKVLGNNIVNAFTGGNPVNAIYSYGQLVWERSIPNNVIYYTSSDGNIITPDIGIGEEGYGFGANIVSNTYSGGRGVIVFDGPVTIIGVLAFNEAYPGHTNNLVSITIPNSVTRIERLAFSECLKLKSINIPYSITYIGNEAFYACESLTSIIIPDSVTYIGARCFQYCYSLASYVLSSSITIITESLFDACTVLRSVVIPSGITKIEAAAYDRCNELSEVIVNATTPPVLVKDQSTGTYNQFNYNAQGRKIKVPAESLQAYKTATGWSDYADDIVAQ